MKQYNVRIKKFVAIYLLVLIALTGCNSQDRSKPSDSDTKNNLFTSIQEHKELTDKIKNEISVISFTEAGLLGEQQKINGMQASDLNGDGTKEIVISINYIKDSSPMGRLQVLTWDGSIYKGRFITNEYDDVYGQMNFAIKKLANDNRPQVISWWAGGNKAYLTILAQVLNEDSSFSSLWEKDGIAGGSVQIENEKINIYSNDKSLVCTYPANTSTETDKTSKNMDDAANDFQFKGVSIHMKKDEVSNLLGQPQKIEDQYPPDITLYYEGFEVYLWDEYGKGYVGEGVYSITIKSNNLATSKGIKIGDSIENVEKILGKASQKSNNLLCYNDNQDWTVGSSLYFSLKNNKVSEWGIISTASLDD